MSITASVTGSTVQASVSGGTVSATVAGSPISASPAGSQASATIGSGGTTASVSGGSVAAAVTASPVSASASGGVGPQGPAGAAGDVTVPAGLANLSDVQLASTTDGDLLRYSSGKWRNYAEDLLVDGGNFVLLTFAFLLGG